MPRRGRVLWSGTSGRPSRMPTKRNEPAHCGLKSFLVSSLFRFCSICCAHLSASRLKFTSVSTTIRSLLFCADAIIERKECDHKVGRHELKLKVPASPHSLARLLRPYIYQTIPHARTEMCFQESGGGQILHPPSVPFKLYQGEVLQYKPGTRDWVESSLKAVFSPSLALPPPEGSLLDNSFKFLSFDKPF